MADHIYLDVKPDTLDGLRQIVTAKEWADLPSTYVAPEQLAWLTFQFRYVEDRAGWFPRGKWATIQWLQSMVEKAAEAESLQPADSKRDKGGH